MSDTKNTGGDKTLHVPSKTLSLKRPVEQGVVRQSFSHGRQKVVVVEKVKRRAPGHGEAPKTTAAPEPAAPAAAPASSAFGMPEALELPAFLLAAAPAMRSSAELAAPQLERH